MSSPTEGQIRAAARDVMKALRACDVLEADPVDGDPGDAVLERRIVEAFRANFREEVEIENAARALLTKHARAAFGMDQQTLIMKFKQQIAKERGFVL